MRLKVYDENGRYVSGCEVSSLNIPIDEVRDIYAKACGHVDAESMSKCGFPVENYTFTTEHVCCWVLIPNSVALNREAVYCNKPVQYTMERDDNLVCKYNSFCPEHTLKTMSGSPTETAYR